MKRYPEYKDSGEAWIGEVPTHWEVRRLGARFQERRTKVSDADFPPLSVTKNGIVPQLETAAKSDDGDNRKLVKSGDFVINSRSDRKGSSGVSDLDGSVSLINIVLQPRKIDPGYCHYLLKGNAFVEEYYRNGRGIVADLWTTRYAEMKNIKAAFPSLGEQTAIADFLDDKTAKIDEAIAQKERMIKLLQERKQILIQTAVTKGLAPNVPMKDSGIDCIGEIPAHWEVVRAKYLFKESDERSSTGAEELLSVSHLTGVTPRSEKDVNMFLAEDYTGSKLCHAGDLVYNIMWAWMGALGVSPSTGIVSPAYGVYRQTADAFDGAYLELLLRSVKYLAHYNQVSTGLHHSRLRFYPHMFFDMFVGVPPREEQNRIMEFISSGSEATDAAITGLRAQITSFKQFRATLIDSAVTGKIKVT